MKHAVIPLVIIFMLILGSCLPVDIDPPKGFAVVKEKGGIFRASSPEGMNFSLRSVKNYPEKDLPFWEEALKNHLSREGYIPLRGGSSFSTKAGEGVYFEWVLPYKGEDYIYLTGILVAKRKIIIAEAGGQKDIYMSYREELMESLNSLR